MVEIKHLSIDYKKNRILDDINLSVNKGEICGIVGRNGSGKTLLMKCICGFLPIKSGEIIVDDKVVGRDVDFPESMGIMIEYPVFSENKTGLQNLLFLASIKKIASKETIMEYMNRFQLDPKRKTKVKKYSLGMKQKLGIIQAIMENPALLILDEPFNSLDEESIGLVRRLLLEEKEKGKTILISSHNKEDIELLCDQVYRMK